LSPDPRAIRKYTLLLSWIWGQAVTRPHKIQLDQLGQKEKNKKRKKQQASSELDNG